MSRGPALAMGGSGAGTSTVPVWRLAAIWHPLRGFGALVLLLVVWELGVRMLRVPEYLLPPPSRIAQTIAAQPKVFAKHIVPTLFEAAGGLVVGNLFGLAAAVLFHQYRPVGRALLPVMVAIRTVPIVAITPLITLLLGRGAPTMVTVAGLVCFFPTLVNAARGLAAADPEAIELMRLLSASRWQTFVKVRLAYSLPYLFAAFRISATACVLGAMVAEWLAGDRGLGWLIEDARVRWQVPVLWAAIAITTILAISNFAVTGWTERRVAWWSRSDTA